MTLPNFLYIGPDKSGSTWMYELLRRHPRVFVPAIKDLYFFDRYYARGLDWYARFFAAAPATAVAIGELSHDYLFSEQAAERIARDLPDVRVISSLRNPVDRTFSHYLYLRSGGLTTLPFWAAMAQIPELTEKSLYHRHLRSYFDRLPRERIGVVFYEDLVKDERAFAERLLGFLGVAWDASVDMPGRTLAASTARNRWLALLAKRGAVLARDVGLTSLVGWIKYSPVRRLLFRPYRADERPRLTADDRSRLWERFEADTQALERQLGVALDHWRPSAARGAA